MEQLIITGATASGMLLDLPGQRTLLKSIEIDLPLSEVGSSSPSVTVSGSVLGAYTFHRDTTLDLQFGYGEAVYITSANFSGDYSAVIRYLRGGDSHCSRYINDPHFTIPIPTRLR